MSTYFETKSNDLDQIISRLQSVLREQEEDDHMSGDSMSLIEDYVFPFMNDLKQGIDGMLSTGVVAPFYGTQIFLKISRIMELVMPCGESGDRTRRILLDIIMRMPIQFDAATPVLIHLTLCDFYWNIIEKDTEEMALLAIKGFVDAYASGVGIMLDTEISGRLHKFIVWLRGMYTGAAQCFETQAGRRAEGQNSTPVSSHESVRVLIECCSSMVYTLTQVFSSSAESYLTSIVGDMVSLFSLNDVLSDRVRQNPDLMSDLFEVQVKTLTFISYLCRSMNRRSDFLRSFDTVIAKSCIRLLKSIPVSNINVRRELILNLRSYLYSPESAAAYIPYIDELFDDTIIVGIGKSAHEVLRPIVVSALADFVNTIRDRIPVEKLKRIFGYFCGTMSDSELPVATQYTSARIILNLIDYFFNRGGSRGGASAGTASRKNPAALAPVSLPDGPEILREVLRSLIEKFSSLILFMPNVIGDSLGLDEYAHLSLKRAPVDENKVTPSNIFDENIAGGINVAGGSEILMKLIGKSTIPFGIPLPDLLIEGVREIRSLIRTLLLGVKMILHCLTHRSFGSSTSAGGRTTLNRNECWRIH
jgi:hypothetical protein